MLPLFCEPVLATWATKKEYSSELGPKNYSKMEPGMEPKRQRPTLTKHAQALSDYISTPIRELHFHCFLRVPKKSQTNALKSSIFKIWRQNGPNSDPPGIPTSRQMGLCFGLFGSWAPLGAPFEHRVAKRHSRSSNMSPKIVEHHRTITSKSSNKYKKHMQSMNTHV